jgi:hypothetical protein
MAILKKWSAFTNRANLSDNDNAQVMLLDTTVSPSSNQNQRTPITQLLRSGKNLSDLEDVSEARTNLGIDIGGTGEVPFGFAAGDGLITDSSFTYDLPTHKLSVNQLRLNLMATPGVVHNNGTGDLSSSLIVNADVSASADIDTSKLAPFSGGALVLTTNSVSKRIQESPVTSTALETLVQTANQIVRGNGTDGLQSSANLTFDGTTLTTTGFTSSGGITVTGTRPGGTSPSDAGVYLGGNGSDQAIELATAVGSNNTYIDFTQVGSDFKGRILYANATNTMSFSTNGSTQLSIDSTAATFSGGLSLPTSGGTASLLNYNEDGSFSITLTGPVSLSPSVAFSRVGKVVTMTIQAASGTSTSGTFFFGAGQIPSRLRPSTAYDKVDIGIQDNGTYQSTPGRIIVDTNGDISIYKNFPGVNFTGSGACGWTNIPITYRVA